MDKPRKSLRLFFTQLLHDMEFMDPKNKVRAAALGFTVTIIFAALNYLIPLLHAAGAGVKTAVWGISVFASAGVYQTLATSFSTLLLLWPWGKRIIFGGYYLEGTWVGYYQEDTYFCYVVEVIEQDLDTIVIKGSSYDQNLNRRAQWTSDAVTFDAISGVLNYSYTCHIIPDKTVDQGIAIFSLVRERTGKAGTDLYGYSTDVKDGTRTASWEHKITHTGQRPEDALKEAIETKKALDAFRVLPPPHAPPPAT